MRHYADVNRVLDRWWMVRVSAWTGQSTAMEEHCNSRNLRLDGLNGLINLITGGYIAGERVGLATVDSDLFDRSFVVDRIHIYADYNGAQETQLDGDFLSDATTRTDNLSKRKRERGQCIKPIYEKVRCELFITHHCHLIVNVFGRWREENAKECLGDGVGREYPEIDDVVEQHQQ